MGVGKIRTNKLGALGTAIVLVFASAQSASASVLDFEGFDPGRIIDDGYAPDATINAINLGLGPDIALIFYTTDQNPAGEDFDLVGPFDSLNSTKSQDPLRK